MPAFHRYLQAIVDAGFARRVMFGSDQVVGRVEWGVESSRPRLEPIRDAFPTARLCPGSAGRKRGLIVV